jgi:hypothetical protein
VKSGQLFITSLEDAEQAVKRLCGLSQTPDGERQAENLAASLPPDDRLATIVCTSEKLTLAEARRIARLLAPHNPSLDMQMLRLVAPNEKGEFPLAHHTSRVLDLVGDITNGTRAMPVLLRMLRQSNGRVLSKLLLLIGQLRRDPVLLGSYTASPDARVRANALEALWGSTDELSMNLFLGGARDAHHRVAINGLVGLHIAGRPTALGQLERLTKHDCPLWRAAAVWALGKVGEESTAGVAVRQLMNDSDARVRGAALRATIQLRKRDPGKPVETVQT